MREIIFNYHRLASVVHSENSEQYFYRRLVDAMNGKVNSLTNAEIDLVCNVINERSKETVKKLQKLKQ